MTIDHIVLKADMHLHTNEDPQDSRLIKYSSFDLIDHLAKNNFDVFSITLHNYMFEDEMMRKVRSYAKERGMLFIPGIEKSIEKDHILIFNMQKADTERIDSYEKIKDISIEYAAQDLKKRDDILVVASHPFFPSESAIDEKFEYRHQLLHGLEYNSFYLKWDFLNFNNRGVEATKRKNKIMLGNTDAHVLEQIGNTYSKIIVPKYALPRYHSVHEEIDFKNMIKECSEEEYNFMNRIVIHYIKKGNVKVATRPLKLGYALRTIIELFK